jgi:hypothetical protein
VANCEERIAEDQRKREFDLAVDALKLEVTLFWQRSDSFGVSFQQPSSHIQLYFVVKSQRCPLS